MKKQKTKKDKHLLIKEKICDILDGRKEKEDMIIGIFFGEKNDDRNEAIKSHKVIYKAITKNIKKMNTEELNRLYKNICGSFFITTTLLK